MDRRVDILRSLLLCLFGVVTWLIVPASLEASVVLIGAGIGFMPGCGCHCSATSTPVVCALCDGGSASGEYVVVLSGLADEAATCSDCNGTWVCTHTGVCKWTYDTNIPNVGVCGTTDHLISFSVLLLGANYHYRGSCSIYGSVYDDDRGTSLPTDCLSLSGESLPFSSDFNCLGVGDACNGSAGSCLITSI